MIFNNFKLIKYQGSYKQYTQSLKIDKTVYSKEKNVKEKLMVIENKINRIMGMISTEKEEHKIFLLDKELHELLIEKNSLTN